MTPLELKEFLDEKVERYNNPNFIESDPIQIPHLYSVKEDIEISGFFAAILAWGQRKTIINKCSELLEKMDDDENKIVHRDVNGVILQAGDSVVLIKDLKVKGSSMVAKQGTAVRNIRLDHENAEYIEGKVDGQQIVIITQYVKKI